MSPALKSQKLILAAGAACVLAIAVVYVLRIQMCNKNKKQRKKEKPQQEPECKEISGSSFECSSTSSSLVEQQESDPMHISAIAPPEAISDDLRLDSGIGSPKGTPSLENRSASEQIVEQTSDLIEESFSAVYTQSNGIDSSSLFVEASTISMAGSEPELHESLNGETTALIVEKQIEEVVENICGKTTDNMTEDSINITNSSTIDAALPVSKENDHSKKLEFSPEASPAREIKKSNNNNNNNNNNNHNNNNSKKDTSPMKEKVSRRKSAARHKDNPNKDPQNESPPAVQPKTRNNDDRNNNNTRRQSTGSDLVTDSKSEGSADSSKAGSDTCPTSMPAVLYNFKHEFEIPWELCGRLIGRQGSMVKDIRERTGAIVTVRPHPVSANLKQVYVVGKAEESVKQAMAEIRKRFPLKVYPLLTLNMVERQGLAGLTGALTPDYITLPEDQDTVVVVTAIDSGNQLCLQSPYNLTYNLFMQQEVKMKSVHGSTGTAPPALPANLLRPNAICVMQHANLSWYRMAVDSVISPEEVRVKYVDYGGHDIVHPSLLKQIRSDFIYVPFQAIDVLLADIEPVNPDGKWTNEAIQAVQSYVDEENYTILARVEGYSGRVPCVQLTCLDRTTSEQWLLSHQLVSEGHAKWVTDSNRSSPEASRMEASSGPTFSPADFPQLGATQQTC